ncbi:MAG TPA: hypothetical protein VGN72_14405 [Tepidisphaeraceae bacterium]|jgi:uncharacterized membrane protein|nr:hypothetical protein [Tepidisphaeraceae bacterium]
MAWPLLIWNVHLAATWFMVGLIWFVQIVHYPQFDGVGPTEWSAYHRRHLRGTTFVVLPAMLIELGTAIALLVIRPKFVPVEVAWIGFALLGVVWVSTFLFQVPCHDRLAKAYDSTCIQRLSRGNWVRTSGWTVRGLLLIVISLFAVAAPS